VTMDARPLLLATAYRNRISEPTIEGAFERFREIVGPTVHYQDFCDAVAACLAERLIFEPVRLPEGVLQCHWCLELTPAGVACARRLAGAAVV